MQKVFPKIEFIDGAEKGEDFFLLLEGITFDWEKKPFTVPAGFTSDGASVPRFLWDSVSPRVDPATLSGAIGHDFLYRTAPPGWTRKMADDFFYDCIRLHGLSWWKAQKAYWGVRLFGSSSWQGKEEEEEKKLEEIEEGFIE